MQGRTRPELYRDFMEFIQDDIQHERSLVHRRMFNVLLWCFLLPALVSALLLMLVKMGAIPRSARGYLDWLVLIFPVSYSLYILGSEVLNQVPAAFRRGGVSTTLGQALKDMQWRTRVCEAMNRAFPGVVSEEWSWVIFNYRTDLEALQSRNKYMTALAGAVFFLIMQGIDSISGDAEHVVWEKNPIFGWIESNTNDLSQFVGLGLFLVLLYVSGNQTYHSLSRYLRCAELNLQDSIQVEEKETL
jgi:hypothetical protein